LNNDTVNIVIFENRYSVCKKCDMFVDFTKQCIINKEFLDKFLTKESSECPQNQWV
jgi:hypothetical protein